MLRHATAAGVIAAAAALAAAPGAGAATITPTAQCFPYVPSLAGEHYVGLTGSGFTPNTDPALANVALTWDGGDLAGYTPLAADGSFPPTGFLMPSDFIDRKAGHVKTYNVTATDNNTPGLTAATQVTFVRASVSTKPSSLRNHLSRKVIWAVYGAPSGAPLYAHWVFKGKRYATRSLGTANGPCGIARKRVSFLPVKPRTGTWRVYITNGKAFKRENWLFRYDLTVFRTFGKQSAAKVDAPKVAPRILSRTIRR
jgi:hypothetical protein